MEIDRNATFDLASFPKRILTDAKANLKETGVNTLCAAIGMLRLTMNGKQVETPILLQPLESKIDRIKGELSFLEIDDSAFINPFVLRHVRTIFELEIPNELLESGDPHTLAVFFESKGLEVDLNRYVIGNFHHHRYQLLKELEELQQLESYNPALKELFGEERHELPTIEFSSANLFPADIDHEAVFDHARAGHLVIQGPPGTGKSQVIGNLIGKALTAEMSMLVVSEKRSALEVIQSKLASLGLDTLCFIAGSDRHSEPFLKDLKRTWDFFESYQPKPVLNLMLSEQYEDHLQMTLDLLAQTELIGGVSFHQFLEQSKEFKLDQGYSSRTPSIAEFIKHRETIEAIYSSKLDRSLAYFRLKTLQSDAFLEIDQSIKDWKQQLTSLQSVFELNSWSDLSIAMQDAALCQVFENDLFKQYAKVLTPNSKERKQFDRLSKQYLAESKHASRGSEWKIVPSILESNSLLNVFNNGTFLARRKAKRRWQELSHLPVGEAKNSLQELLESFELAKKHQKIVDQLSVIGIHDPANELERIRQSFPLFSDERWGAYSSIPVAHRSTITNHHSALERLHRELLSAFDFEVDTVILDYLSHLEHDLAQLISLRSVICALPETCISTLQACDDFTAFGAIVYGSNYTRFKERFPAFSHFHPSELKEKVSDILEAQQHESKLHATHLLNLAHARFLGYHTLLTTPSQRLSAAEKELKKTLKRGKAILVKEFGKTRSHPSLRELFHSDAQLWIEALKPVWLSNPSSLALCFPMEEERFDFLIFDEASQIPIQHALGAIQRSRRIVVAGDEHQMGPAHYFQSSGKDQTDLLHQARYYFPKVPLLHHYRSEHPDLIAFSNKHFYEGKLRAYPSYSLNQRPLTHHFVEGGRFIDRTNEPEAKALVSHLKSKLASQKSIGVVAFSEEQLNCIWKTLGSEFQEAFMEHQEKHGGFFKALENVQGDECDALIIGFGYAQNETGDFHKRFGPMNTANGRKRLNVLLTRARVTIDFFCSVRSSDFTLSDNESINLLRQWIAFSENARTTETIAFPYGLTPTIEGNSIQFNRIQEELVNARELTTLQGVLEGRGWNVQYE